MIKRAWLKMAVWKHSDLQTVNLTLLSSVCLTLRLDIQDSNRVLKRDFPSSLQSSEIKQNGLLRNSPRISMLLKHATKLLAHIARETSLMLKVTVRYLTDYEGNDEAESKGELNGQVPCSLH